MKRIILFFVLIIGFNQAWGQRGLGTNNPNPQAALHIVSPDKGVLLPQISLLASNTFLGGAVASTTHIGMLVYNTNTAVNTGLSGVGYYFWNGTSWEKFGANSNALISGTTTNTILRWSGTEWVESDSILASSTGVSITTNVLVSGTFTALQATTTLATLSLTGAVLDSRGNVGTTGQVLSIGASGTLWTAAATGTIASGTVTDSLLRWDGRNWIESTTILVSSTGVSITTDLLVSGNTIVSGTFTALQATTTLATLSLTSAVLDSDGDVGTPGQVLSTTGTRTNWVAGGGSSIVDADGDTSVNVEQTSDEDIIRFTASGSQTFSITNNTIRVTEPFNNIFIGSIEPNFTSYGGLLPRIFANTGSNTIIGNNILGGVGGFVTENVIMGNNTAGLAGGGATGFDSFSRSVIIGDSAQASVFANTPAGSVSSLDNVVVGARAAEFVGGINNVFLGASAGRTVGAGTGLNKLLADNSIYIGNQSRSASTTTSNEIVIGSLAVGLGDNTVVLGNVTTTLTVLQGNVGIGTTSATVNLQVSGTARFTAIQDSDGDLGTAGQVLSTTGTRTNWVTGSGGGSSIVDADGDTSVNVEQAPDEDIIRLTANGSQTFSITKNSIEITEPFNNIFIGGVNSGFTDYAFGPSLAFYGSNTIIGDNVLGGGRKVTITRNVIMGNNIAGTRGAFGTDVVSNNVIIGDSAQASITTGPIGSSLSSGNVIVGAGAAEFTGGINNVFLGRSAGRSVGTGSNNKLLADNSIYIGNESRSAIAGTTDNEIVIGARAIGLGDNTVVLGTASTTLTALQGNVGIGTTSPTVNLQVSGTARFTAIQDSDGDLGTFGQVLSTTGSRTNWVTGGGGGSSIVDADGDTSVNVEQASDEDIIRFTATGSQTFSINKNTIGINEPFNNIFIGGVNSNFTNYDFFGVSTLVHGNNTIMGDNVLGGLRASVIANNVILGNNTAGTDSPVAGLITFFRSVIIGESAQAAVLTNALGSVRNIQRNVVIGASAAEFTGASGSVFLGASAGRDVGTDFANNAPTANKIAATNSIYIGSESRSAITGLTDNEIVIGAETIGLGDNSVVLGNTAIATTALRGYVGIGTTTPAVNLQVSGTARFTAIQDSDGDLGTAGQVLSTTGTRTNWVTGGGGGSSIADADNDTRVDVERTTDDDTIRFFTPSSTTTEVLRIAGNRLEFVNPLRSVFIGKDAGVATRETTGNNTNGKDNIFIGENAGLVNTSGSRNIFIGADAGVRNTTGVLNLFLGQLSGRTNTTGDANVFLGREAGFSNTIGQRNTFVGNAAGYRNLTGNFNVFFGNNAGLFTNSRGNNTASFNSVLIGNDVRSSAANTTNEIVIGAGALGLGDNSVVLGNASTTLTVLKGLVATGPTGNSAIANVATTTLSLLVTGTAQFTGIRDSDGDLGTAGQVLSTTGTRTNWVTGSGGGSSIADADGDTRVIVQQTTNPDDDNIRFFTSSSATEVLKIIENRLEFVNPFESIFIGENAGAVTRLSSSNADHGRNNIFIGQNAGLVNTIGNRNVFIGTDAGISNTSGELNVFLGRFAGQANTTGGGNTFLGPDSGQRNITGVRNTFVGNASGFYNTVGQRNVFLGNLAGIFATGGLNTSSSFSVIIGDSARSGGVLTTNEIVIGFGAQGLGDNSAVLGNDDIEHTLLKGLVATGPPTGNSTITNIANVATTTLSLLVTGTAQFTGIRDSDGGLGIAGQVLSTTGSLTNWVNPGGGGIGGSSIVDTDGDTRVQVEQGTSDDDVIKFFIPFSNTTTEVLRLVDGRLEFRNISRSIYIGENAGRNTTTGADNIFIGLNTGLVNTSGNHNIFIGESAGLANTSGRRNIFIGEDAGRRNITGELNVFLGELAGQDNTTGSVNVFLGSQAGHENITGIRNTFVGFAAGYFNTTGRHNVFLGFEAGVRQNNGAGNAQSSDSVFIGRDARSLTSSTTNEIVIGSGAVGFGDNTAVLGHTSIARTILRGNVGIGTTAPTTNLHVNGTARFTAIRDADGDLGTAGQVLSTTGARTNWINASSGGGGSSIVDGDNDTRVEVERGTDDDTIRFTTANAEVIRIVQNRLEYVNSRGSIYIGSGAGQDNAGGGGSRNIFIGNIAGSRNIFGNDNVFLGREAGFTNTGGNQNVFVGNAAGYFNRAHDNVYIGHLAGAYFGTSGTATAQGNEGSTNSVFIGHTSRSGALNTDNEIVIGADAVGLGNNSVVLGNANIIATVLRGSVGIRTTSPRAPLEVNGAARFLAIQDADGDVGTAGQVLSSTGTSTNWITNSGGGGGSSIADGDSDTRVDVELTTDDDTIRFTTSNTEVLRIVENRLEFTNSINSIFIGGNAGRPTSGSDNVFIGQNAGLVNTTGDRNVFIGSNAGVSNDAGQLNVFLGQFAGHENTSGNRNTFLGREGGYSTTTGDRNTFVGTGSGYHNVTGEHNVFMGDSAGIYTTSTINTRTPNTSSNYSILIGNNARSGAVVTHNEIVIGAEARGLGTNTVRLGNASTTLTALEGNVGIGTTAPAVNLQVSGTARFTAIQDNNGNLGIAGQVLSSTGTSTNWINPGETSIVDDDGDTRVEVQQGGTDNDIIRFTTSTNEVIRIAENRLEFVDGTNNVLIGSDAGDNIQGGGDRNVLIGTQAGNNIRSGDVNTYIGYRAGEGARDMVAMVGIGNQAGRYTDNGATTLIGGSESVYIGNNTTAGDSTPIHEIVIGSGARGLGDRTTVLGSNNTSSTFIRGNVAIGTTTTPTTVNLQVSGTARFTAIQDSDGDVGTAGQVLSSTGTRTNWTTTGGTGIVDNDGDTRVDVERTPDDDTIRFTTSTNEVLRIVENRLEFVNSSNSVFIGRDVGGNVTTGIDNTYVGQNAAFENTTGSFNTVIGTRSLFDVRDGDNNTAVGAAISMTAGGNNTAVGARAGIGHATNSNSIFIGHESGGIVSGAANGATTNSIFIGQSARSNTLFSTNQIVIGAGAIGLGDNTVILGNASTTLTALEGNVGIGTTSPTVNLQVSGTARFTQADTANATAVQIDSTNISFINSQANSIFIGDGDNSSASLTTPKTSGGSENNILIGNHINHTVGTGFENVYVGHQAAAANTTGNRNVFLGGYSGESNTDGANNVYIGSLSGRQNTSGTHNVYIGREAGLNGTTGTQNLFLGSGSGYSNNGTRNVILGYLAGTFVNSGGFNTGSTNSVYLGARASSLGTTAYNEIVIGDAATGLGTNTVRLGNASTTLTALQGNVGVHTATPRAALEVNGAARLLAVQDSNGDVGTFGQVLSSTGTSTNWTSSGGTGVVDNDGDTRVEVQQGGTDDDIIRFTTSATEVIRIAENRLEFVDGTDNVLIGENAGDNIQGRANVLIGDQAGNTIGGGGSNTYIGHRAGADARDMTAMVGIGNQAGRFAKGANLPLTGGSQSVYIGNNTTAGDTTPIHEIVIGSDASGLGDRTTVLGSDNTNSTFIRGNVAIGTIIAPAVNLQVSGTARFTAIQDSDGDLGTAGQLLSSTGTRTNWTSSGGISIADNDGDTRVEVERTSDDDTIRFTTNNAEVLRIVNNRLEFVNSRQSVYIGSSTGAVNTGQFNVFIGINAGRANTTGNQNTILGVGAGTNNTTGSDNVFVGFDTGLLNNTGRQNTFIGNLAGRRNTTGNDNVFIGNLAGTFLNDGSNNTGSSNSVLIGRDTRSAALVTTNEIVIGAGAHGLGNNTTVLGSDTTVLTVLKGLVATGPIGNSNIATTTLSLLVTGTAQFTGIRDSDGDLGTAGQLLSTTGTRTNWTTTGGTGIADADGDTRIQVQQGTTDDDTIRFFTPSSTVSEVIRIVNNRLEFVNPINNSIFIGENAGRITTGLDNVFIGRNSGRDNSSGRFNTFIGAETGQKTTGGQLNVFIGAFAGQNNVGGNGNVFLGQGSGQSTTIGERNTFVGTTAGHSNTTGFRNVFIGNLTGVNIGNSSTALNRASSYSILIGDEVDSAASVTTNEIVIGARAVGLGDNTTLLGNVSTTLTVLKGLVATGPIGNSNLATTTLSLLVTGTAQFTGIRDSDGDLGTAGQVLSTTGTRTNWTTNSVSSVRDGDSDTRIEVAGVSGDDDIISFFTPSSTTSEVLRIVDNRLEFVNTTGSVYIGRGAGDVTTTGGSNIFIGTNAGLRNTVGSQNTFVGSTAGSNNIIGADNTFVGFAAGLNTTGLGSADGEQNTFIGSQAGISNTLGSRNTFVGYQAGDATTIGTANTFIGRSAGSANINGSDNVFIGTETGLFNTTGQSNLFIGTGAGFSNTVGSDNTFVGRSSGGNNISGNNNVFVGRNTGINNTTGAANTFIGRNAGFANATGSSNVFIGDVAGVSLNGNGNNTASSNSIFIGVDSRSAAAVTDNEIVIGAGSRGLGSNSVVLGNTDIATTVLQGNVGIGTTAPTQRLSVSGTAGKTGGGSWATFSDLRIKKDINPYTKGLAEIIKIKPVTYDYNDKSPFQNNTGRPMVGIIAQDIQKVLPSTVKEISYGNFDDLLEYDASELTYTLINAIKELNTKNETLEAKSKTLEAENKQLRTALDDLLKRVKALEEK